MDGLIGPSKLYGKSLIDAVLFINASSLDRLDRCLKPFLGNKLPNGEVNKVLFVTTPFGQKLFAGSIGNSWLAVHIVRTIIDCPLQIPRTAVILRAHKTGAYLAFTGHQQKCCLDTGIVDFRLPSADLKKVAASIITSTVNLVHKVTGETEAPDHGDVKKTEDYADALSKKMKPSPQSTIIEIALPLFGEYKELCREELWPGKNPHPKKPRKVIRAGRQRSPSETAHNPRP